MIFDGQLYCSSRTQFNDPFDCIALSLEGISQKRLEEFIDRRVMEEFTALSAEDRLAKARELKLNPEQIQSMAQKYADILGILSLSAKRDNILMWSHYANSHQGFCLEFDTAKAPFSRAHRVQYQRKRRAYDLSAVHEKRNAENFLLTKYEDWRYEQEWRLIVEKGGAIYACPPDALTGVIFGCRMLETDKAKVRNWVNHSPCSPLLYQARLSNHHFRLDIERC
jgi:Protein of unknown function (DUF2971)